ncbi:MAG: phosphopyruvate hydratase [candidate division WOR-3 bacterium]|nr:phosphopyruvate hydratase [candidate division WOR-3 bacterium]MCX7757029.1 phosphopyruvate hydratase [candidate division WOR-3 bacterium]MDW7987333.1 phosphopyruvate hydratase [candidate division WOR-3 bacterium]
MKNFNGSKISQIYAREILDSRGNPTLEIRCYLESGVEVSASVPSGASVGQYEALELRDNDSKRYLGKGVLKAIENVNKIIAPAIIGEEAINQKKIDQLLVELDGTSNKSKLGANAILGVSMAVARAAAEFLGIPLYRYLGGIIANTIPTPMLNVINGGVHASNNLDLQEYMIVPSTSFSFSEQLRISVEVYHTLKKVLAEKNKITAIGDEGGYSADFASNEEPLAIIMESIERAGYEPGKDLFLALDSAASEFYHDGKYHLKLSDELLDSEELLRIYEDWINNYPIISIEDGFAEGDELGWKIFTKELGEKIQIVGDDIFVTNLARLRRGYEQGIANAVLIKLNQIGTVTETLQCIKYAYEIGYKPIISHRSGETEDTFISDLAVAANVPYIKTGAPARGERVCKYNRLLFIESEIHWRK